MSPLLKIFRQLPMLLASISLLLFFSQATPTPHASQISSLTKDLSPRIQPLERSFITRGSFYPGLYSFVFTTTTFLAQGPYSSTVPARDMENFAQQVLEKVATKGAAENAAYG